MRITINPEIVSEHFAAVRHNSSMQESAQLFARGLPVAEMIQAFAMNRNVLSAFAGFETVYPGGALERGILEKVILCISERNECQFCVNSHRDITQALGIANKSPGNPEAAEHSPRERLAIEYALAVHRDSNRVPDELYGRLRAQFTDAEIVELTFLIGFINMLNWFNNALEVRYRGEFGAVEVH
jgi:AhpD family alkylhydroperoxidase